LEITEYEYETETDRFWTKSVTKDTTGDVVKSIIRTFDEDRMPITETITEDDLDVDLVTTFDVKYCPVNYELLSKTKFFEGNTISSVVNEYDDEGWLIKKTEIDYCFESGYVNTEGNNIKKIFIHRYFPDKSVLPKGEYEIFPIMEKGIIYSTKVSEDESVKVGDVVYTTEISFNDAGEPVKYFAGQKDCADHALVEYYKLEKDENGRILSMISYADEKLESFGSHSTRDIFKYDDEGMLAGVEEHKYNDETGEFDRLHDRQDYEWIHPEVTGAKNYTDFTNHSEHYCFGGQRHSKSIRKIVKFDEGEKIIEFYNDGYNGAYLSQQINPKLHARLIYVYKTAEK
ncbi:MAG: hypothetical protein KAH48_07475, partial [Chlorobi bacterium]|nr:hypothetical protein [Chlorobiota bacterium]